MGIVDKSEIEKKGFIDLDVDKSIDIVDEIHLMRKQKNAVILAWVIRKLADRPEMVPRKK